MVVADADPRRRDTPGYYLDARDATERTLARVAARGAFGRSARSLPRTSRGTDSRIDVPRERGAFTVTLPAVDAADHVTMVRIVDAADRGAGVERAQLRVVDLASFPLAGR